MAMAAKRQLSAKEIHRQSCLTYIQARDIADYLRSSHNLRDYALFLTAYDTMLIDNDLLELKVKDIQSPNCDVSQFCVIDNNALGATSYLRLSPRTRKTLLEYIQTFSLKPDQFLFPRRTGERTEPISRIRFQTLIKKWVKAIGADPTHFSSISLHKTKGLLLIESQYDGYIEPYLFTFYWGCENETLAPYICDFRPILKKLAKFDL